MIKLYYLDFLYLPNDFIIPINIRLPVLYVITFRFLWIFILLFRPGRLLLIIIKAITIYPLPGFTSFYMDNIKCQYFDFLSRIFYNLYAVTLLDNFYTWLTANCKYAFQKSSGRYINKAQPVYNFVCYGVPILDNNNGYCGNKIIQANFCIYTSTLFAMIFPIINP